MVAWNAMNGFRVPKKMWITENKYIINMKHLSFIIEGTFEVKLPTIWANGKAEVGRVREEKGAEPPGEMRYEKLHGVVARSSF